MCAWTHRSFVATSKQTVATASAHPNRRSRFVRKVRFGARRRDLSAVTVKIFLLPNRATQSPCARHFDAVAESPRQSPSIDHRLREFKNAQQYRRFLQYRAATMRIASAFCVSICECVAKSSTSSRCALSHCVVNTSLSGKLFFLVRWCIRDVVHLDSRVHEQTKAISLTLGGQHGQESEEGEEGEERSEEDCEEDPQGREEEEVTSLLSKVAGDLMPARHWSLR